MRLLTFLTEIIILLHQRLTTFTLFSALNLSLFALAVQAQEPDPVFVDIELEGAPYEGEGCTGGDWRLSWRGPVHVEEGPLKDLLISYTAFDTSHEGQRPIGPASLDVTPVVCVDDDGKVVMNARTNTQGEQQIQVTFSLAENSGANSPAFIFSASDLAVCTVESEYASYEIPGIGASVHTGLLNPIEPALDISLEDLEQGFNKTYQLSGTAVTGAPVCMGSELATGKMVVRYKSGSEDPEVSMDACLHLAINEQREVNAVGTPDSGQYRFTSSPANVLQIVNQQQGSATISGQTPGKGTVTVEYSVDGKSATAQLEGSVVKVDSVNGGGAIPKLGLYDYQGKKIKTLYDYPLKLSPSDGFVQFTVASQSIASVVNTPSNIQIQPLKTGTTTLQAKTLCGSPVGDPVEIEIVRCDDEVKESLRKKQTELKNRMDTIRRRITGLTADEEFDRAAREIGDTTRDMAIKTGETIINTLSFGETEKIAAASRHGIQLSREVLVNGTKLSVTGLTWDIINTKNDAEAAYANPGDLDAQVKFAVGAAVLVSQNSAVALGKTYGEAYLQAQKFGKDLGLLVGVAEQLEELEPQHDKLIKEYIGTSDRIKFCEQPAQTTEPESEQPKEPKKDAPKEEVPDEEPTEQEPTEPKQEDPEDKPKQEEPPEQPPEEETPGKSYGLTCRFEKEKQFSTQLKQLLARAEQAKADALNAQAQLQKWQDSIADMASANEGTEAERKLAFARFNEATNAFLLDSAESGERLLDYLIETEKCPEKLEVKVSDLRVKYN